MFYAVIYDEMPDTYVIFICDFDPAGEELYRYCYEMTCLETGTTLNDGIHRFRPSNGTGNGETKICAGL